MLRPDARLVLVADGIEYAGNLGTLVRTADAAGVDGLVLTNATCRLTHPKVFEASRGTVLTMPMLTYGDVAEARRDLTAAGFTAYVADPAAATPLPATSTTTHRKVADRRRLRGRRRRRRVAHPRPDPRLDPDARPRRLAQRRRLRLDPAVRRPGPAALTTDSSAGLEGRRHGRTPDESVPPAPPRCRGGRRAARTRAARGSRSTAGSGSRPCRPSAATAAVPRRGRARPGCASCAAEQAQPLGQGLGGDVVGYPPPGLRPVVGTVPRLVPRPVTPRLVDLLAEEAPDEPPLLHVQHVAEQLDRRPARRDAGRALLGRRQPEHGRRRSPRGSRRGTPRSRMPRRGPGPRVPLPLRTSSASRHRRRPS